MKAKRKEDEESMEKVLDLYEALANMGDSGFDINSLFRQ